MKALMKIKPGKGGVQLSNIDTPFPKSNELKIKINAAGICGTDMHIFKDEYSSSFPVVMGHEYSGIISEVGSDVKSFKVGDRVISLTAAVYCGKCKYCNEGLLMLCPERLSIGSGVNGAFCEYMVIPEHLVFKIPENVTLDEAVLSEPLACVVRSVIEMSKIKAGDYVLVSGPGTIGLLTMQVAKACGGIVVVTGTNIDNDRLELAKKMGAYETINVNTDNIHYKVNALTDGNGFDIAFECAGVEPSAQTCLKLLKKTGQYVQVGLYGNPIKFDHDLALMKEIHIVNSFASEKTSWEKAIRLMKYNMVDLKPLISAKLPLEEWQKGFDMAFNKEGYKILLYP